MPESWREVDQSAPKPNPLAGLGSGGAGDMFAGMGEFWDQLMESDEMRAIMDLSLIHI